MMMMMITIFNFYVSFYAFYAPDSTLTGRKDITLLTFTFW